MRRPIITAIVLGLVLAACTTTKTIIVQATPNTGVKAAHRAVHQASAVACGLLTCSHGRLGQACAVAGTRGVIVQVSPTQLACDTEGPVYPPPGAVVTTSPPGQASPVSTSAQLSSTCTPGFWDYSTSTFYPISQTWPQSVTANDDQVGDAYQVTLTNNSGVTANVDGLAAVFYNGQGQEITSDQESFGSTFITPSQSLTSTEHPWDYYYAQSGTPTGPFLVAPPGGVDQGDTCQLVQWSREAEAVPTMQRLPRS